MIQKWVKPILPTPAICLTALLILVFTSTGLASNGLYEPCADTRVQRSDGFTLGIAFSSRPSFFIDQSHQLSPCDRRLSLASLNSQLAIFRPKVDEISLLTVNTSTFFPILMGHAVWIERKLVKTWLIPLLFICFKEKSKSSLL
ncbi:uncharacterized protein LOC110810702 isoform X2 [Carica papaya]|uniref:uncharacterized protein LOC110810702 isoform X2 n=1 Tax=Carica papaya TaxID=3649 RepID=UPI000B8CF13B|nr:uncharacterized protein LOC110810702 isoform X2 [Carica papaya]